jgi:hypothetical protein
LTNSLSAVIIIIPQKKDTPNDKLYKDLFTDSRPCNVWPN